MQTRPVIFCDFDGTITERDVNIMLLEAFAPRAAWQPFVDKLHSGEMTIAQGMQACYDLMPANQRAEYEAFVDAHVRLRDGFGAFARACHAAGVPLVVVSGGLDFFIDRVLAPHRPFLHDVIYNHACFDDEKAPGVRIDFAWAPDGQTGALLPKGAPASTEPCKSAGGRLIQCEPCGRCGLCKLAVMAQWPRDAENGQGGWHHIAIGDGVTDLAMLEAADTAFARGWAAERLPGKAIVFDDFHDIQAQLAPWLTPLVKQPLVG